jgi:UDP-glucose 4-epimerase
MKGLRLVITGGAGFIGSNLVRSVAEGNEVVVIDDLSTGRLQNIKDLIDDQKITFIRGSITDVNLLQKTLKNVDYVFHEAAIPSVPRSIIDPIASNVVNVNGTLNVLVAAKDNHVKKVVYASSSSIYGETPTLPKREEMSPCPLAPYAVNKLTGEYYCQVFTTVYGLPTVSLRYFNVYGPRQDPTSEYAAVIPSFITRVLKGESPVIYGDGEQTRDFTFINDVVTANILAAESNVCGVFNIAGGRQVSINNLARLVIKIFGKDLGLIHKDLRLGDIRHSFADISKASEKLKYKPRFDLSQGLKETGKWFQNN